MMRCCWCLADPVWTLGWVLVTMGTATTVQWKPGSTCALQMTFTRRSALDPAERRCSPSASSYRARDPLAVQPGQDWASRNCSSAVVGRAPSLASAGADVGSNA